METTRRLRRMVGFLSVRLPEVGLGRVPDPRGRRGRRWKLAALLTSALVTLLAGARSTADAERLTATLSPAMRRRLRIGRRVPDTTLRDTLCVLDPDEMRRLVHRSIDGADRRKALVPDGLPFGVAAMDGKSVTLPSWDADYMQRHVLDGGKAFGMLRTITSSLVSARGAPCLDAFAVPGDTNESGAFADAFAELVRVHGARFQLITYDAGAASEANAAIVVGAHKHYLFALKADQPLKLQLAQTKLEGRPVLARTEDVRSNRMSVIRTLRLAAAGHAIDGAKKKPFFWPSTRTIVEVTSETLADGTVTAREVRTYLCSLAADALTPPQWLRVVRRHWGVENDCHKTFDVAFGEDDHPWIEMAPQGALVVLLLRRLAYNLLALFRSITQRSDERRAIPWRDLMSWVHWTLLVASDVHVEGLRARQVVAASA